MAKMLNELVVLNDVAEMMSSLSKGEQRRIVSWLEDYFGIFEFEDDEFDTSAVVVELSDDEVIDTEDVVEDEEVFEAEAEEAEAPAEAGPLTLEGLFAQVAPKTAIQKIVTAAYWLDAEEDKATWKSFEVNKLLKSLGYKLSSVSGTLAIESKKPEPMVIVQDKSSDSMQGRKTFRLSEAGLNFVEDRLD